MSAIAIVHLTVDPANLAQLWKDRKADFESIIPIAKAAGCLSHRWAFGDGEVVIIDEWKDGESFQKFFAETTKIGELMQAGGVQGPPRVEVLESKVGPDTF